MESTSSPVHTDPVAHSPSDVSYSSGASHTSTRTTSPATSSRRSSPLLDLHHLTTTHIEGANHTPLDTQPKMDRRAFQPVNARRDKLITEGGSENTPDHDGSQFQRPFQQAQALRSSGTIGVQATRSLTSNNWRTQSMAQAVNENLYNPFDSASRAPMGYGSRTPTSFPLGPPARMDNQQTGMIVANMATFSDIQLDNSYAYCFDRGNGQYTRLIPADMLPPLQTIPAVQQGCQGMIVLPQPRSFPANGRSSNTEPVDLRTPPATPTSPTDNIQVSILSHRGNSHAGADASPTYSSYSVLANPESYSSASFTPAQLYCPLDPVQTQGRQPHQSSISASTSANSPSLARQQSRIDNIVASTPATPTHHHQQHGHHPTSSAGSSHGGPQHHHHNHSHQQQQQQPQRRPKIYCDKWVHEGVCAFTQQGCKYKHEMPFDKATQNQLGLFHGLPAWWKKHQAELARQRDVPAAAGTQAGGCSTAGAGGSQGVSTSVNQIRAAGERSVGGLAGRGSLSSGGGSVATNTASTLAWRQRSQGLGNNGSDDRGRVSQLGSGTGVGGHGAGSLSASVWNPSPFGPIAPPPRAAGQASQSSTSPTRGIGSSLRIPTDNPYASLGDLDEDKSEEQGNGAQLA
ncbi:hypothetical protein JX265_002884 [Neoarthrinium moseri]|uniref:C3H1-type domain-containing protein n=1 Tax=Neoarthrinium moseri TaxID=1658444 RepID=A0A9P9WT82_9PEZI|nr:hypothetical protein JX265_002884 [Neoarthrinium moseri]